MRLWLASRVLLLRRQAGTPFTWHALAEFASSSDANRRLFSSCNAAWHPPTVQKKRSSLGANGNAPACHVGGRLLLNQSYYPTLEFLRKFADGYRGSRPPGGRQIVNVSSEIWQLLEAYDVPATIKSAYGVHIEVTQTTSKQVQLTLGGRKVHEVVEILAYPPLKLDVPEAVGFWLITEGPQGLRAKNIRNRSSALVNPSRDKKGVLLGGSSRATLKAKSIIDGLHVKRRRIPQAVYCWLTNSAKGSDYARSLDLEWKFDTCISSGQTSDDDPAHMVDLAVVGEREENVDGVLAVIDGLHVKHGQIAQVVHAWLVHTSEGAEYTRSMELVWKFDSYITLGPLSDDKDSAHMMDFAVAGEREENDETDTCIEHDEGARCMYVAGRADRVREAVKEISKTQHISLRTSVVSFAMANYVGRARRAYENDVSQVHLANKDMLPGTWELRRLHVVASQGDDAELDKADEDLMRKLDLDEIVLEAPEWAQFLRGQCLKTGELTGTGIGFSEDAINRRVIVDIAGSRSTVKEGMTEVIRRIEGHASYNEGDICLRRIQGQSVDTDGFKKIGDAKPLDSSRCKEPFAWKRLTRERWSYAGAPRGGRPP